MERALQITLSWRETLSFPHLIGSLILATLFCLFHYYMGGFMLCHLFFAGLIILLYLIHPGSRRLVLLASPLLFKEVIFDSLRYLPFEWLKPIHVSEPYLIDTTLFGFVYDGVLVPLNEYLLAYSNRFLDLLFGLTYHLLEPVSYLSLILLWRLHSIDIAKRYAVSFLLMNLLAFVTYILYPAAAPWYVMEHGFVPPLAPILGNPAGLAHFDTTLGLHLSANIYNASPFVFGAIPSMHAGMTMMSLLFFLHLNKKWSTGMSLYALTMWVGALYLQHHYLIDVLLGILYALAAYFLVEKLGRATVNRGYRWILNRLEPDET